MADFKLWSHCVRNAIFLLRTTNQKLFIETITAIIMHESFFNWIYVQLVQHFKNIKFILCRMMLYDHTRLELD